MALPIGLIAASTATKLFGQFQQASIRDDNLVSQITGLDLMAQDLDRRHAKNIRVLRQSARKVTASQKTGFIRGGVKLEGSAMDVINDTMMDLMREEENREVELSQQKENIARRQDALERQRGESRGAAIIGGIGTVIGGASGFFG